MGKYVIGDIHGCVKTLKRLLDNVIPIKKQDQIYFLGDYINKGPDSKGTLEYLMHLSKDHQCYFLRGNHEQTLIDLYYGIMEMNDFKKNQFRPTFNSFGIDGIKDFPEDYLSFIERMDWYYELESYLLVHAGFNMELTNIFEDKHALLNTKIIQYQSEKTNDKKIIRGHIPYPSEYLKKDLAEYTSVINLDTGCVYRNNPELSKLSAYDFENDILYQQENIEAAYEIVKRP